MLNEERDVREENGRYSEIGPIRKTKISEKEQYRFHKARRKTNKYKALEELYKRGEIGSELLAEMKSIGGQPARLYGLAKVHKIVIPLRPVLSMPGSP